MGVQSWIRGCVIDPRLEAKAHKLTDEAIASVAEVRITVAEANALVAQGRKVLEGANVRGLIVGTGVVILLTGAVAGIALARAERQQQ